ncbi:gamma carbonic anhydrase family protein [Pelagibacterium flavum]|jgi:carbonic anhydrase/acetyltransferase-like protein (isoleucine patch superfamily)|uniref:Gamma carbonic anhydrase family protein n=1 Tax=Pelagibacterium flavum TaxID=2984530 RepID=A0ABY6IUK7_9HYPH|nr:gamma carbonic anhydrase family protein [Pelagibacterium sp. YIM 151497]UYQ73107.1 gamma carbonic anhydrase family protein [Pelagibacterium sp. YIM 151497]|tara:strand:- start:78944 stop:79495 length:552 start_codon:yes stop_codon:yes gene_type:complete
MTVHSLGNLEPQIAADAGFIAHNATIVGNVRIAARASVWFGAVIRGDNELIEIGESSNVQDNAVMHTDPGFPLTIGSGCTIGHLACLHGCTIGDGSLVGMRAVILNGAKIGKYCLIGAGSLVTETMLVPDCSLVIGVPGKVVRTLSEEQIADLGKSASTYLSRSERFTRQFVENPKEIKFWPA